MKLLSNDLSNAIEQMKAKGATLIHKGENYAQFTDKKLGDFELMYFYSEHSWVAFKDLSTWQKGSKIVKLFNL